MSGLNAIKIVVDTNLWISFCIGTKLSSLIDAIIKKRVVVCFSEELYGEIFSVLKRPRIQAKIKDERINDLHNILEYRITYTSPRTTINDCRDPKDNFLLELAVSAKADYLVTGDDDLLSLNPFRGVTILNARDFEDALKDRLPE